MSILKEKRIEGARMKKEYQDRTKVMIQNREIHYRYEILETLECGIELKGTEVKSIREGMCNLKDSFAMIKNCEVILKNTHISPYEMGNINNVDPVRDRKLLLHKREILKLSNKIKQGGYTLIPSKMYSSGRWMKIELALCRGKKIYDKRETLKERESKKSMNEFKKTLYS